METDESGRETPGRSLQKSCNGDKCNYKLHASDPHIFCIRHEQTCWDSVAGYYLPGDCTACLTLLHQREQRSFLGIFQGRITGMKKSLQRSANQGKLSQDRLEEFELSKSIFHPDHRHLDPVKRRKSRSLSCAPPSPGATSEVVPIVVTITPEPSSFVDEGSVD